ncbi:uncharacterized protein LOC144101607 [Amblyomma americanum]
MTEFGDRQPRADTTRRPSSVQALGNTQDVVATQEDQKESISGTNQAEKVPRLTDHKAAFPLRFRTSLEKKRHLLLTAVRTGLDPVSQCAKVLKGLKLPCDADVPLWFYEVERLFTTYDVPENSRVHLIMPALTERVRYLLRGLKDDECGDYDLVKKAVLNELKLTPAEYLDRFERAAKRKEETWAQFASRVKTYFHYYLRSRDADSKEDVVALVVADRMKASLSNEGLEYVRLREGEKWVTPDEMSRMLQTLEQANGKGRAVRQTVTHSEKENTPTQPAASDKRRQVQCFVCRAVGHRAKDCPRAAHNAQKTDKLARTQRVAVSSTETAEMLASAHPHRTSVAEINAPGSSDQARQSKLQQVQIECAGGPATAIIDTGREITVVRKSLVPSVSQEPSGKIKLVSAFGETIEAKLVTLAVSLKRCPTLVVRPETVHIVCALTGKLAEGVDCLLSREDWELLAQTDCRGGALAPEQEPPGVSFSVAEKSYEPTPTTGEVHANQSQADEQENDESSEASGEQHKAGRDEYPIEDQCSMRDDEDASSKQREKFRSAQLSFESLRKSWEDAKSGKEGMFISDGLLYHRDSIAGAKVKQLVLPLNRREERCNDARAKHVANYRSPPPADGADEAAAGTARPRCWQGLVPSQQLDAGAELLQDIVSQRLDAWEALLAPRIGR